MKIRAVELKDYKEIKSLHLRNDLSILEEDKWINFWRSNPLNKNINNKFPIGWVLLDEQKIVGHLGNIVKEYYFKHKRLVVACSHAWVVDQKYRIESLKLKNIFFSQNNIDIFIVSTPNKTTEKIFSRYGAKKIPIENLNNNLFLILDAEKFVASLIKYKKIFSNKIIKYLAKSFLKILLFNKLNYWKKFKNEKKFDINQNFGKLYQEFWNKFKVNNKKLIMSKSPEWMNWHMQSIKNSWIISISDNEIIKGYALCCDRSNNLYDLKRSSIIDVVTENDEKELGLSLIHACIKESVNRGYHIIDMIGLDKYKQNLFYEFKALNRNLKNYLFYYYTKDPDLSKMLENKNIWSPTLLDGDSFLI